MSAISGSFVRLQTMADGTPRLVIDLDCSLSEAARLDLTQGAPLAIARLTQEAAQDAQQREFLKGGPLSKEAAGLCKREDFQRFVSTKTDETDFWNCDATEDGAAGYIRYRCCISSRAELDHSLGAAQEFGHIKREFQEWSR